jgi:hypothetical protein
MDNGWLTATHRKEIPEQVRNDNGAILPSPCEGEGPGVRFPRLVKKSSWGKVHNHFFRRETIPDILAHMLLLSCIEVMVNS